MKKMNINILNAAIGMVAFIGAGCLSAPASAQVVSHLEEKEIQLSEFNAIDIEDDFEVTLVQGAYAVRVSVDADLAPYVEKYVKSKTLYVSYDEKAVPKDIKKNYKGKNAIAPVFRVVVYMPEIESITLSDNASLTGTGEFISSKFKLNLKDKAQVKTLSINTSTADISMKRNAQAALSIQAERSVEATLDGNANMKLSLNAKELAVNASGSAIVAASGKVNTLNLTASNSAELNISLDTNIAKLTGEGSSKMTLTGSADELNVKGVRSSTIDALNFHVTDCVADLSNSALLNVDAAKTLTTTLNGGSVYYTGTPEFKIVKIIKSTLAPYGTK